MIAALGLRAPEEHLRSTCLDTYPDTSSYLFSYLVPIEVPGFGSRVRVAEDLFYYVS